MNNFQVIVEREKEDIYLKKIDLMIDMMDGCEFAAKAWGSLDFTKFDKATYEVTQ